MLKERTLVVIVLLPLGLALIYLGGWIFAAFIALILALAAGEFSNLYRAGGLQPARLLMIASVLALTFFRAWDGFASAPWLISLLVLVTMSWHLLAFERGRDQAATDFAVSLAGSIYLGWLGPYLLSLRDLDGGLYWLLLALFSVWFADSGAYFIGTRFGRHQLSPRLSPKKTWEGYFGGILAGVLGSLLMVWILRHWAGPDLIQYWHGAVLGLVLAVVTTLGDLGESMIKRQFGVKDSSHLIPGHGGVFDRIDTWLWAAAISYHFIVWLFV
ncbi:MAG: phosphatidate cytidylyltransferase [Anaerolineales bacterium]|nr:phosphatidate cytidylyltransferase [Anaerolineales bacterium]